MKTQRPSTKEPDRNAAKRKTGGSAENSRPVGRPEWAVLGYFVADTTQEDIDKHARAEIEALGKAAELKPMGVSVFADFKKSGQQFVASFLPSAASQAEPCGLVEACEKSQETLEVKPIPEPNVADYRVLRAFLKKAREVHPNKRYLLFIYGHGGGPLGLFDDSSADGESMPVGEVDDALEGTAATIVLCRTCFVSTLETAVQLKGSASYLIGTQAIVPETGIWPWIGILSTMLHTADSKEVADAVTLQVGSFYLERENREEIGDVPYSLIDVKAADNLLAPIRELGKQLIEIRDSGEKSRKSSAKRAIDAARFGSPSDRKFAGDPALVDIRSMCKQLGALDGEIGKKAKQVLEVLNGGVILREHSLTDREAKDNFSGVSLLYLPTNQAQKSVSAFGKLDEPGFETWKTRYAALRFCKETRWHEIALKPID